MSKQNELPPVSAFEMSLLEVANRGEEIVDLADGGLMSQAIKLLRDRGWLMGIVGRANRYAITTPGRIAMRNEDADSTRQMARTIHKVRDAHASIQALVEQAAVNLATAALQTAAMGGDDKQIALARWTEVVRARAEQLVREANGAAIIGH